MRYILLTIFILLSTNSFAQKHNSDLPVEITSDTMEIKQKQNIAVFKGNVEANQDNLDIRSNKMTVHYSKASNQNKQSSVSKVEIEGDVFISTPKETAQGKKGLFNVDKKLITLDGDVVLTSGKNVVKGESLVYNLQTGESKIISNKKDIPGISNEKKGRVKGVFIPGGS